VAQTQLDLCAHGICVADVKLAQARFEQEEKIAVMLRHPNVTQYFGTAVVDGCPWLVMERSQGSLDLFCRCTDCITLDAVKLWMQDVLAALSYCRDVGVCHLDVKASNFLTFPRSDRDSTPLLKLCDFGFSELLPADADSVVVEPKGSEMYTAPEVLAGRCARSSDTFSFGIMFAELIYLYVMPVDCRGEAVSGVPAVYGPEHRLVIVASVCSWLRDVWMEASSVLQQCASHDPSKRPSPQAALCDLHLDPELACADSDSDESP
jgi:serine/threonine protein kinase